jgi:cation transport ATPase
MMPKISELPNNSNTTGDEVIAMVQNATTKKAQIKNFFSKQHGCYLL